MSNELESQPSDPEREREEAEKQVERTHGLSQSYDLREGLTQYNAPAAKVVRDAFCRARDWCGPEIMERATLSHVLGDGLLQIIARLRLVEPALDAQNGIIDHTIGDLIFELEAIAAGDEPRLLARRAPGKRGPDPFRKSVWKLEALMWGEFLEASGEEPIMWQRDIGDAYGVRWDTIRKWRGPCEQRLGEEWVEQQLRRAEECGRTWRSRDVAAPTANFSWPMRAACLHDAGEAYRAEAGLKPRN